MAVAAAVYIFLINAVICSWSVDRELPRNRVFSLVSEARKARDYHSCSLCAGDGVVSRAESGETVDRTNRFTVSLYQCTRVVFIINASFLKQVSRFSLAVRR